MPEYYLTECEINIFDKYKENIFQEVNKKNGFNIIELGCGDGFKTLILLKYFYNNNNNIDFIPIDISLKSINRLKNKINEL